MRKSYFYLIAFTAVVLDQVVKYIISTSMQVRQTIGVIGTLFSITYVRNTGAAFGVLSDKLLFLTAVSILLLILILIYLIWSKKEDLLLQLSLGFIAGGSIGNLIDRIFRGYVIDYFDVKYFSVFNAADICINIGAFLIIIRILFMSDKKREV